MCCYPSVAYPSALTACALTGSSAVRPACPTVRMGVEVRTRAAGSHGVWGRRGQAVREWHMIARQQRT